MNKIKRLDESSNDNITYQKEESGKSGIDASTKIITYVKLLASFCRNFVVKKTSNCFWLLSHLISFRAFFIISIVS